MVVVEVTAGQPLRCDAHHNAPTGCDAHTGRARTSALNRPLTSLHDRVAHIDNKPRRCFPASHLARMARSPAPSDELAHWSRYYRGCDDLPCSMRCGPHCGLHKGTSASYAQYKPTDTTMPTGRVPGVRGMNGTITGTTEHPYVHRITQSLAIILFADVIDCAHLQHHV